MDKEAFTEFNKFIAKNTNILLYSDKIDRVDKLGVSSLSRSKTVWISRPDLGEIRFKKLRDGKYHVDRFFSSTIEFTPTRIFEDKKEIHPGRLWYQTAGKYPDGSLYKETEEERRWYDSLKRKIKILCPRQKVMTLVRSKSEKNAVDKSMLINEYISESLLVLKKKEKYLIYHP
jgi:hypothetical protein